MFHLHETETSQRRQQFRQAVHVGQVGPDAHRQVVHDESGSERIRRLLFLESGIRAARLRSESKDKPKRTKQSSTSLSLSSSSSYFFCTSRLSDAFVIFLEFSFLPRLVCSLNNGIPHPELSFYFARVPSKRNTVDQPFVVLIISWYCYLWRAIIFLEYIRRWRNIRAALPAPFYWKQRFLTENTGHQDKKFQLIVKGTNRKK